MFLIASSACGCSSSSSAPCWHYAEIWWMYVLLLTHTQHGSKIRLMLELRDKLACSFQQHRAVHCGAAQATTFSPYPQGGVDSLPDSTAQHSSARHRTAQLGKAQLGTAQHSSAQHSSARHSTARYSPAEHSSAQPAQPARFSTASLGYDAASRLNWMQSQRKQHT